MEEIMGFLLFTDGHVSDHSEVFLLGRNRGDNGRCDHFV